MDLLRTAAYDFPAAIGISSPWASALAHQLVPMDLLRTAAYDFPAAIGISSPWASALAHQLVPPPHPAICAASH
eukprot:Skav208017  [mRNA]  locus=scaffold320:263818:264039:- [translate_table: standard]